MEEGVCEAEEKQMFAYSLVIIRSEFAGLLQQLEPLNLSSEQRKSLLKPFLQVYCIQHLPTNKNIKIKAYLVGV